MTNKAGEQESTKIKGSELEKYFDTDDIDFIIKDLPQNEIQIILLYEHNKTGKVIEINWHTMNISEIAQEQNFKRFTKSKENSIFRRLKLKHNMPHEDRYNSYKYEVVGKNAKSKKEK